MTKDGIPTINDARKELARMEKQPLADRLDLPRPSTRLFEKLFKNAPHDPAEDLPDPDYGL